VFEGGEVAAVFDVGPPGDGVGVFGVLADGGVFGEGDHCCRDAGVGKGIWVCEEDATAQMLQFCVDNAIAADVEVVPSSEVNTARPPVSRRCRSMSSAESRPAQSCSRPLDGALGWGDVPQPDAVTLLARTRLHALPQHSVIAHCLLTSLGAA
jgi:hypothetical protein